MPLQITDPYALSKRVDEETAAMIHRRYRMTVVAMRLPAIEGGNELAEAAQHRSIATRHGVAPRHEA